MSNFYNLYFVIKNSKGVPGFPSDTAPLLFFSQADIIILFVVCSYNRITALQFIQLKCKFIRKICIQFINLHTNLLHSITVADCNCSVVFGLKVISYTERSTDLILSSVTFTNVSTIIIFTVIFLA